jgi:hypothetical protein
MPPPLLYFKVNICPLPLPHFASIFFTYLWSCRWHNYIVTLPRYFSFRLPQTNSTSLFGEIFAWKSAILYCNQFLPPLTLWIRIPLRRGVLDSTLCDKVCQWLATGRWFSPGTMIFSTNKTDRHDIKTENIVESTA